MIYPGKVTEADVFRVGNIGQLYPVRLLLAPHATIFFLSAAFFLVISSCLQKTGGGTCSESTCSEANRNGVPVADGTGARRNAGGHCQLAQRHAHRAGRDEAMRPKRLRLSGAATIDKKTKLN